MGLYGDFARLLVQDFFHPQKLWYRWCIEIGDKHDDLRLFLNINMMIFHSKLLNHHSDGICFANKS